MKDGLTVFLKQLNKATGGLNVNLWTGGLTWFANTAHVADVQPYIDNLELSAYWDSAPFNTSDAASWDAYDTLGYTDSQALHAGRSTGTIHASRSTEEGLAVFFSY